MSRRKGITIRKAIKESVVEESIKVLVILVVAFIVIGIGYFVYQFYSLLFGDAGTTLDNDRRFCEAYCKDNRMEYRYGGVSCVCASYLNKTLVGINRTVSQLHEFHLEVWDK